MNPEEQAQRILALEQENQALRARIAELERRLGLDIRLQHDSQNSGKY